MRAKGVTQQQVAAAAGIGVRALQNLVSGSAESRAAKQRIADYLGADSLFPGITPSKRRALVPSGAQFLGMSAEEQAATEKEFSGRVKTIPGGVESVCGMWVYLEQDPDSKRKEKHYDTTKSPPT